MSMNANKKAVSKNTGQLVRVSTSRCNGLSIGSGGSRGRLDWKNETERHAIGGIEEKTK